MAESPSKKAKMSNNQLEQLKKYTIVVADTGDIDSIKQFTPTDATTNPSLILASATKPQYEHLLKEAITFAKSNASKLLIENFFDESKKSKPTSVGATENEVLALAIDKVCVNFGVEILKLVEGVVSTEVDARLSFDTDLSVARARRIIKLYDDVGIKKERILIKLASTWEGFQAAKILKKENIKCNMTLLFSFSQAIVAAQEEVELISPFVGRILDWNKNSIKDEKKITSWIDQPNTDPGVLSVKKIYNYYKKHGIKTIVMGASFRNKGEILELSGCDKLTIGPKFLKELEQTEEKFEVKLTEEKAKESKEDMEKIVMNEKEFRWALNEDQMATEKLSEGIRKFAIDIVKLEKIIQERLD